MFLFSVHFHFLFTLYINWKLSVYFLIFLNAFKYWFLTPFSCSLSQIITSSSYKSVLRYSSSNMILDNAYALPQLASTNSNLSTNYIMHTLLCISLIRHVNLAKRTYVLYNISITTFRGVKDKHFKIHGILFKFFIL